MKWLLSWLSTRYLRDDIAAFSRPQDAKKFAEKLVHTDLQWQWTTYLPEYDREEPLLAAKVETGESTSDEAAGEFVIARTRVEDLPLHIADYSKVVRPSTRAEARSSGTEYKAPIRSHWQDVLSGKVRLIERAMRDGRYLVYEHTNSKRKTYTGMLKPTGWETFVHDHPWAGGETLCVVGYCYRHNEERWYAVKRMTDIRVLDDPDEGLRNIADNSGQRRATRSSTPAAAPFVAGDRVFHSVFGHGRVILISGQKAHVDFDTVGRKLLSLRVAKLVRA